MEHRDILEGLRTIRTADGAQRLLAKMMQQAGRTGLPVDQCAVVVRATLEHEIWNQFPDYDRPRLTELFLTPIRTDLTPLTRLS